jgi:hypothetical protein
MVPPLLADMLRHAAASHLGADGIVLSIITDIDESCDINEKLGRVSPDLIILGPRVASLALDKGLPVRIRKLTLSSDLTQILGPEESESDPLTPASFADRLREIARSI